MTGDWKDYFPFEKPRKEQIAAIDEIIDHIKNKKKYILLQLGTGVGKSAIAVTISRWIADNVKADNEQFETAKFRGGIILTSQKILQDQYSSDFDFAADLRSASNYECLWASGSSCGEIIRVSNSTGGWPCNLAGCVPMNSSGGKDFSRSTCPYAKKRSEFWKNEVGITNYSYMLSAIVHGMNSDTSTFHQQVFVLDECHKFEDEMRKWSSIFVDRDMCRSLMINFPNVKKYTDDQIMSWIKQTYKPSLEILLTSLELKIKSAKEKIKTIKSDQIKSDKRYKALKPILRLYEHLDMKKCQLTRCLRDARSNLSYVIDRNYDDVGMINSFEVKPVSVARSMREIIYNNADHVIFMSATILDKEEFCRVHGIPENETAFINIDSPFKPESFGIVYSPIASMKMSEIDKSIPKIVKRVKKILSEHPNEKGIIHAGNFKVSQAIFDSIKDDRLLVQQRSTRREIVLEEHLSSSEPTVLVSPSMMEGLDLRDDLGRFQIICKVPFPYMGDSVVKKIMEKNKKWYSWRTALVLIQSVGRCVRNETDWSKTYILDECFGSFFVRWIKYFPASFGSMTVEENQCNVNKRLHKT